jgi:hypothetical protein
VDEAAVLVACRSGRGELSFAASGVLKAAGSFSCAGGEISGVDEASDTGGVVVALLSSFGVELAASMFFSPLSMDEPLGAPLSVPRDEAPAALSVCEPRTAPEEPEPDKSDDSSSPVTQTGVPSDFSAHSSLPVMVLEAV